MDLSNANALKNWLIDMHFKKSQCLYAPVSHNKPYNDTNHLSPCHLILQPPECTFPGPLRISLFPKSVFPAFILICLHSQSKHKPLWICGFARQCILCLRILKRSSVGGRGLANWLRCGARCFGTCNNTDCRSFRMNFSE